MLILSRRIGETIVVSDNIFVTILRITGNQIRIGIDAPREVSVHREEVYQPDTARKGVADIIIGKQRNGPVGEFHLTFLGEFTRFENLMAEDYSEGVF